MTSDGFTLHVLLVTDQTLCVLCGSVAAPEVGMEWVEAFFADGRVSTVVGLILLDVTLAVAAAIRRGEFDAGKVARFFRTMVVPYVVGYLGVYGAAHFLDERWLGPFAQALGAGFTWVAWLALVANLATDVLGHARELGYGK